MRSLALSVALSSLWALCACGGDTSSDPSNGGSSGNGGSGGATSGGAGGSAGSQTTGGSGGSVGGSAGVGGECSPVAPTEPCGELSEVGCMAAYPRCVPSYEDSCCPSCTPGPCADCTSWKFYACLPFEESNCTPGTVPHCAHTPTWACQGGQPICAQAQCTQNPGCVEAIPSCPADQFCPSECHALTASSCGPACAGTAPVCSGGVPEVKNGTYTGACIVETACKLAPPCPLEPAPDLACPVLGQFCQYGPACGGTFCNCVGNKWECYSTPC